MDLLNLSEFFEYESGGHKDQSFGRIEEHARILREELSNTEMPVDRIAYGKKLRDFHETLFPGEFSIENSDEPLICLWDDEVISHEEYSRLFPTDFQMEIGLTGLLDAVLLCLKFAIERGNPSEIAAICFCLGRWNGAVTQVSEQEVHKELLEGISRCASDKGKKKRFFKTLEDRFEAAKFVKRRYDPPSVKITRACVAAAMDYRKNKEKEERNEEKKPGDRTFSRAWKDIQDVLKIISTHFSIPDFSIEEACQLAVPEVEEKLEVDTTPDLLQTIWEEFQQDKA